MLDSSQIHFWFNNPAYPLRKQIHNFTMYSLTLATAGFVLVSFLLNGVVAQGPPPPPHGCMGGFKNFKEIGPMMATCATTLGLKPEDMIKNPQVELPKNGYDDKCFMKCVMAQRKYVKDDGTLDLPAIQADFNANAPDGKADALYALMKTCSETTAKDPVISKDPCKSAAMTKLCFMKGQETICPPPAA